MKTYMKYLAGLIATMLGYSSFAQTEVFNISDHTNYETCDAIMHDDQGGLVPYSAGANFTITLCAPAPETQINLYFIGFDLSDGDSLWVYDGADMSATLLGGYSGGEMLFQTLSSSTASGCLTVHFESNNDDQTGDFSIRISCGVPCDYPVALIEAPADTVKICPGESVTFDGSNSYWTEGANLASWEWDFGDNTSNTTAWPTVTKTFNTPGGYRVRLYLTDDNDCYSANIPEIIVFVATDYDFDLAASATTICIGDEVLIGNSDYAQQDSTSFEGEVQNGNTVTWIETNTVSFENGVYIPDNQGCFYADLTFNQFGNAVIQDSTDFSQIFFNVEHSFVGDIIINIICPNGQILNIFPEAGGSGTYLGEPIDIDDGVPGVGYTYSFSPNSVGGTWMEGMTGFGGTIPAGDYEPEGNWSSLEGCPLNGTWQLEICDVVGVDDGWVFEFGIQFAPEFYPDVLQFTPSVGNGCDSSYWETPNQLTATGSNCDWALFSPTAGGNYTFTYHVINDFGCEYTEDITITAIETPEVQVDDAFFCGSPINLPSTITNPTAGVNYSYAWTPTTGLTGANSSSPTVVNLNTATTYTVTVSVNGLAGCSGSDEAFVDVTQAIVPTNPNPQYFCSEDFPVDLESAEQVNENIVFEWVLNNSNGSNVVGNGQNQSATQYGQYVLTVTNADCNTTSTVTYYVTPPPTAEAGEDFYYCGNPVTLTGSVQDPIPGLTYGYVWTPVDNLSNPTAASPTLAGNLTEDTYYYLSVYPMFDNTCTTTDSVLAIMPIVPVVENYNINPCFDLLPYQVYIPNNQQPLSTFEWVFINPDTTINYGEVTSVTSSLPGTYFVTITEPNCGLTSVQEIGVSIKVCNIMIPNIMTPNGDGDNDTFNVTGIRAYPGSTCKIYNRWGNLVFEDDDYDGTWNGEDMSEGTYYYVVGVNRASGMEYFSGNVTLIR